MTEILTWIGQTLQMIREKIVSLIPNEKQRIINAYNNGYIDGGNNNPLRQNNTTTSHN